MLVFGNLAAHLRNLRFRQRHAAGPPVQMARPDPGRAMPRVVVAGAVAVGLPALSEHLVEGTVAERLKGRQLLQELVPTLG